MGLVDNMLKFYVEIFPPLKSSKEQIILHSIFFIIQLHTPNKYSNDKLVSNLSELCKRFLRACVSKNRPLTWGSKNKFLRNFYHELHLL